MGFFAKLRKATDKSGRYDKYGKQLSAIDAYKASIGGEKLYHSREEALDVRTSEGVETKKDNKSVFGGKRANLFGN